MTTQQLAEKLSTALDKIEEAKEAEAELLESLENSQDYKNHQKAKQLSEQAEGEAEAIKAELLEEMKKSDEKQVEAGAYKMHTAERENVSVNDNDKLFDWLKKNKKYSDLVKEKPTLDKKALNKYVLDLRNDRQLPEESECGVEVVPNVYIVVKKSEDE